MELSLAVNHSLLALHNAGIYCTEPFRIPYAGKLQICCFDWDRTGRLASTQLAMQEASEPYTQQLLHALQGYRRER